MQIIGSVQTKEEISYKGKNGNSDGVMYFVYFVPTRLQDAPDKVLVKAEHFALYEIGKSYKVGVFIKVDQVYLRISAAMAPQEVTNGTLV